VEQVVIDAIGGLGDGMGRIDGKPVFVPKSCAGDTVSVRIIHETKEAMRAQIERVLVAGPQRVSPPCPHFFACGSCSLQQLSTTAYEGFKRKVVGDALSHGGFADTSFDMLFLPAASRRRVEFQLHHEAGRTKLAYFGLRGHNKVAVDSCLIITPALQALMNPLAQGLSTLPFVAHLRSVNLTETPAGIDATLALAVPVKDVQAALETLGRKLGLARLSTRLGEGKPQVVYAQSEVVVTLGDYDVPLPPDAFLQAAEEAQSRLTQFLIDNISNSTYIIDLFCGIGTYSLPLAASARVHAAELHGGSIDGLNATIKRYNLAQKLSAEARDLFKAPFSATELSRFDCAVINPPRAGAKAQAEALADSGIKRVLMVSCNPGSFARDAKILKNAGFTLTHALGIDQFVWSPHLEIAACFQR